MYIKTFEQISKNDIALVGGKGASLGEMTQAGLPVPPGFVITVQSFDYFIEKFELKSKIEEELLNVDLNDQRTIELASKNIRQIILKGYGYIA